VDLQDRTDINDLYVDYCHRLDAGDAEGWADLFAPEASFELLDAPGGTAVFSVEGRDGLIQMAREEYSNRGDGAGRHWATNILIEGQGPVAHGKCYGFVLQAVDGKMEILAHGNFVDELVKQDDGWRFKRRTCTVIGADRLQ
jgi:hypothetical protein